MRHLALLLLLACTKVGMGGAEAPVQTADAPPVPPPPPPPPRWTGPKVVAEVSVVAVGDIMMHTNVQRSAAAAAAKGVPDGGFPALFEHVRERLVAADLAFGNLETPVAPDHDLGTRSFVFNVPATLLPALKASGFDVLSFANNHVYDQGRPGFTETVERLEASGMAHVGAGRTCDEAQAPRLVEVEGLTIAWLGASKLFNSNLNAGPDEPCAAKLDLPTALAAIRTARERGADAVFYSVHWGVEYHTTPEPAEVADAHALVEGGADVVIGHHPHVVQPIELVDTADGRTGVIAYSLGNFVSNQTYWYRFGVHTPDKGRPRDGLMLAFDVVRKDYGPEATGPRLVTSIANVRGIPLWTDNDASAAVVPAPTIRVVALPDAVARAEAALAAAPSDAARLAAQQRLELLTTRWRTVAATVGEAFVPAVP